MNTLIYMSRSEDSERTFSVFESSCCLLQPDMCINTIVEEDGVEAIFGKVEIICAQGRRQKIFQEGGQRKKRPKKNKKGRKIALLRLYLLYLYHV